MSTSTPVLDRVERAPPPPLHGGRGDAPAPHPRRHAHRARRSGGRRSGGLVLPAPARALGLLAVVSICVGASLPSSPFKLEMGGTWFFGEADWPSTTLMLPGVVAVYGGMILFVRVWYGLFQTLRARGGVPIRPLAYMLALWILPLLVVAPLFSKDVFSYAAQGEMMSHHINPYHYGPGTLGSGPYVSGVDPLWANTPAPYGPLFLMLAGWSASLTLPPCPLDDRAAAPPVGRRHRADRLLRPQVGPLVRPGPGSGVRARRAQPADLARPRGGRPQRRHHGGPAPRRGDGRALVPPRVGCRAVRARRLHQGPGGHRHRLHRLGLGRAVRRLAPPRPHAGAGRPAHRGGHGGAVPRVGPRLGLDRQPGHAGNRALVDGAGHGLRASHQRRPPTSWASGSAWAGSSR